MPVQPGPVTCGKCGEDRPTLIHEITDPRGTRFYCCVCGHEFAKGSELSPSSRTTIALRDSLR